jgi:hypothetical protein
MYDTTPLTPGPCYAGPCGIPMISGDIYAQTSKIPARLILPEPCLTSPLLHGQHSSYRHRARHGNAADILDLPPGPGHSDYTTGRDGYRKALGQHTLHDEAHPHMTAAVAGNSPSGLFLLNRRMAIRANTSWLLRTLGDLGSLKPHGYWRVEGGTLENHS